MRIHFDTNAWKETLHHPKFCGRIDQLFESYMYVDTVQCKLSNDIAYDPGLLSYIIFINVNLIKTKKMCVKQKIGRKKKVLYMYWQGEKKILNSGRAK